MARPKKATKTAKTIASTQSLSAFVKSICDVMRRSNCASALQYVPELTWILFLRILDAQETRDQEKAEAVGATFTPALRRPYRWQDWAAPHSEKPAHPKTPEGKPLGWKRQELFAAGDGKLFDFINKDLLPHLHSLDVDPRTNLPLPGATPKQRIIGQTMTAAERVRVDSEANLRDILDKVHEISIDHIDDRHFFTLSQVYEDLLLKMGEKNSDGGQFFTPREVIRAMVHTVAPSLGQTVYDPCCGTGGFLAIAYEHIARNLGSSARSTDIDTLKHDTFFGREKENLVFPIALANLVLHGIDQPNIWHGNALTRRATYAALFEKGGSLLGRLDAAGIHLRRAPWCESGENAAEAPGGRWSRRRISRPRCRACLASRSAASATKPNSPENSGIRGRRATVLWVRCPRSR
jgi:type I restriction enzyme M protein